ncbi:MAG: ABC transporter permease, partial [Hydrogenovibrio crunogenus]|nr:ABC transporter permease [Hydrogenovibrio crunogenus]
MSIQHSHLPFSILINFAWRNLWRHRRRTLITLTTIGIGFGLAVLFIGIGDGSHNSMVRNAIKMGEGHLTVQPRGYQEAPANYKFIHNGKALYQQLKDLLLEANVAPRISLQVLASTASNSTGAMLEGMQSQLDTRTNMLKPFLIKGHWLTEEDHRGILIGQGMARKLKAKVGSKVVIMAGKQGGDSQAQLARVRGIFKANVNEMDDFRIICNLSLSKKFIVGDVADLLLAPVQEFALFLNN